MTILRIDKENLLRIPQELLDSLAVSEGGEFDAALDVTGRLVLTPLKSSLSPEKSVLSSAIRLKNLSTGMNCINGVGPKLVEAFERLNVRTVGDALFLLPNRYEDRRELREVARLRPGHTEVFEAVVISATVSSTRGGRKQYEVIVGDGTATLSLKWFNFNAVWMKKAWHPGRRGIFIGEVNQFGYHREIHHPEVEWIAAEDDIAVVMARDPSTYGRIVPVYPLTEGLHQKTMRHIMKQVVDSFAGDVESYINHEILARHHLLPLADALREAHFPSAEADMAKINSGATPAHHSLVFDEFFLSGTWTSPQTTRFYSG